MGGRSDVEAYLFVVACSIEQEGVEVGDVAGRGLASIGKDEGYRMRFWETWKLAVLRKLVINETTLASTVYQRPSGYSFLRLGCFKFHVNVCEGGILRGVEH